MITEGRPARRDLQFSARHGEALLLYALGWLLAGLLVVAIAVLIVRDGEGDEISLPPVRETRLSDAARAAGCQLRQSFDPDALRPAVTGPQAPAARPDVYTRAPRSSRLTGALRRGIVVIHYRPSLAGARVDQLERLQQAVPEGTIVAPNAEMPYAVAATAWTRLLGCSRFEDATLDAIRLFRGRFIGRGPDT